MISGLISLWQVKFRIWVVNEFPFRITIIIWHLLHRTFEWRISSSACWSQTALIHSFFRFVLDRWSSEDGVNTFFSTLSSHIFEPLHPGANIGLVFGDELWLVKTLPDPVLGWSLGAWFPDSSISIFLVGIAGQILNLESLRAGLVLGGVEEAGRRGAFHLGLQEDALDRVLFFCEKPGLRAFLDGVVGGEILLGEDCLALSLDGGVMKGLTGELRLRSLLPILVCFL